MVQYTAYTTICDEKDREIEIEVVYHLENWSIGTYEFWGQICHDKDRWEAEIDEINAYATHYGVSDKEEDIPDCKDLLEKHFCESDGKWHWKQMRQIDSDKYEKEVGEWFEDYDWSDDVDDGPDCE